NFCSTDVSSPAAGKGASFAESPSRRDLAGFDKKAFSGDATIKGWSIWNKTREGRALTSVALVRHVKTSFCTLSIKFATIYPLKRKDLREYQHFQTCLRFPPKTQQNHVNSVRKPE